MDWAKSEMPNLTEIRAVALVGCLLTMPILANAQQPHFPALTFFPKNKTLDGFVREDLTSHLRAVKEPSLWKLSQADRTATSYRFLWLATGEKPICVRLTRSGDDFSLHVASHDGSPGSVVGRIAINKDVQISRDQGERILGLLAKTTFWKAPVEVNETRGLADGDCIVIEGVASGKYHVVDRAGLTTGEAYKAFCRSLLELANPASLKAWDRFRKSERRSPDYRAEPSETEDTGETTPDPEEL